MKLQKLNSAKLLQKILSEQYVPLLNDTVKIKKSSVVGYVVKIQEGKYQRLKTVTIKDQFSGKLYEAKSCSLFLIDRNIQTPGHLYSITESIANHKQNHSSDELRECIRELKQLSAKTAKPICEQVDIILKNKQEVPIVFSDGSKTIVSIDQLKIFESFCKSLPNDKMKKIQKLADRNSTVFRTIMERAFVYHDLVIGPLSEELKVSREEMELYQNMLSNLGKNILQLNKKYAAAKQTGDQETMSKVVTQLRKIAAMKSQLEKEIEQKKTMMAEMIDKNYQTPALTKFKATSAK